jgi:hypothetical protein
MSLGYMPTEDELAEFALQMVGARMQMRIDAAEERESETVGISLGFAREIVHACQRGIARLPSPVGPPTDKPIASIDDPEF